MNSKQAVFLDTSVLPRNAGGNQDTRVLAQLVEAGIIEIFLSEIVVSEWTTQRSADFEKKVLGLKKAASDLQRHPWSENLDKIGEVANLVSKLEEETEATVSQKCEAFFETLKAKKIEIMGDDSKGVFARYFDGRPPFSEKKCRKDIPDAFIFAAVERLSNSRPVLVCIEDERLRQASSDLNDVSVFENVKSLVTSLKPLLDQKNHVDKLVAILRNDIEALKKTLSDLAEDALQGFEVEHFDIPDDNNLATVFGGESFENVTFDWDNVQDFESDWISVPFQFTASVELEFYVYRMDAFSVPEWVHVSIGDFEKDHYFEASGTRRLGFQGDLSIKFSEDEIESEEWPDDFEIENFEVLNRD